MAQIEGCVSHQLSLPKQNQNSDTTFSTPLCCESNGNTLAVAHLHRAVSKAVTSDKRRGIPSTFIHSFQRIKQ